MASKRQIREENLSELVKAGVAVHHAQQLQTAARRLHKWAVDACNYGLTSRQEALQAATERRVNDIIKALAIPVTCAIQSDPRGWPIALTIGTFTISVCPY